MSSNNSSAQSGGIGCLTVLGLIFITLKLTGNIDWSWLWVLAPFWLPFTLGLLLIVAVVCIKASRS